MQCFIFLPFRLHISKFFVCKYWWHTRHWGFCIFLQITLEVFPNTSYEYFTRIFSRTVKLVNVLSLSEWLNAAFFSGGSGVRESSDIQVGAPAQRGRQGTRHLLCCPLHRLLQKSRLKDCLIRCPPPGGQIRFVLSILDGR